MRIDYLDGPRLRRALVLLDADVEHLLTLRAVAEDGDAEAAQVPRELVGVAHVVARRTVRQVDGVVRDDAIHHVLVRVLDLDVVERHDARILDGLHAVDRGVA